MGLVVLLICIAQKQSYNETTERGRSRSSVKTLRKRTNVRSEKASNVSFFVSLSYIITSSKRKKTEKNVPTVQPVHVTFVCSTKRVCITSHNCNDWRDKTIHQCEDTDKFASFLRKAYFFYFKEVMSHAREPLFKSVSGILS